MSPAWQREAFKAREGELVRETHELTRKEKDITQRRNSPPPRLWRTSRWTAGEQADGQAVNRFGGLGTRVTRPSSGRAVFATLRRGRLADAETNLVGRSPSKRTWWEQNTLMLAVPSKSWRRCSGAKASHPKGKQHIGRLWRRP